MARWLCLAAIWRGAAAHGFLSQPASRNTLYHSCPASGNPPNWDRNGMNAGGRSWVPEHGHGLCGDQLQAGEAETSGAHFEGGAYANGFIAATYASGASVDLTVAITAHHKGFFEFRLCDQPHDLTQACLDQHLLQRADGGGARWYLPDAGAGNPYGDVYRMAYVLPAGVECERCVLQWYWQTGNSPGHYPEEFWNCADVRIASDVEEAQHCNEVDVVATPSGVPSEDAPPANPELCVSCEAVAPQGAQPASSVTACRSINATVSDQWCDAIACHEDFAHLCEWRELGDSASCRAGMAHISDEWCESVGCDPTYVASGHCVLGDALLAQAYDPVLHCESARPEIPDEWCQASLCASSYVPDYCRFVAVEEGGADYPQLCSEEGELVAGKKNQKKAKKLCKGLGLKLCSEQQLLQQKHVGGCELSKKTWSWTKDKCQGKKKYTQVNGKGKSKCVKKSKKAAVACCE